MESPVQSIVVVTFDKPSKAYQALSVVRQLDDDWWISLHVAAVVEREPGGTPVVRDVSNQIGPLRAPIGLVGRMIDGFAGIDEAMEIANHLAAGTTGLIAEVSEYAPEDIDGMMYLLGGTVYRQSCDEVKAAFRAAEQARSEAKKAEDRAVRERRRMQAQRERAERHNLRIDRTVERLNDVERWLQEQRQPVAAK
jgi:uncharacterized membrane protein